LINILYIKSIHIIFVVTWFSGLFYIVRLFIYHIEANDQAEKTRSILQSQYKIMSKRLWYIITWPSAVIVGVSAIFLLINRPAYLSEAWMQLKLGFVVLLYLYHFICHRIFKRLQNDMPTMSAHKMRLWNEVTTLLLFAIVFLVVLRNSVSWIYGTLGLLGLSVVLMVAVKLYKKHRNKN